MMVRVATRDDVRSIMALESRYYVGNLEPSDRTHGFISVLHSQQWFEAAVDSGGVHVAATDDGTVGGFIAVLDPSTLSSAGSSPIIEEMLGLAATVEFDSQPIAEQRFAFRGPVVIDRSVRGQGLYSTFNAVTRAAYAHRFDIGVLFVAAENPQSLHTTTTKLGAQPLATFDVDSRRYHFLAYSLARA